MSSQANLPTWGQVLTRMFANDEISLQEYEDCCEILLLEGMFDVRIPGIQLIHPGNEFPIG